MERPFHRSAEWTGCKSNCGRPRGIRRLAARFRQFADYRPRRQLYESVRKQRNAVQAGRGRGPRWRIRRSSWRQRRKCEIRFILRVEISRQSTRSARVGESEIVPIPTGTIMRNRLQQFGLITLGIVLGVMLSLNFSAVAQHEAAPTSSLPVEELRTLTEVFGRIKSDYVEPVDDKKLITGAINGMVSDLDPHSAYLEGEDFQELENETSGEFGGLGMEVGMEDGFVKVVSPIDDSPAARANIKSGDLIVKIDDTMVKSMTLDDAIKLMRGKPGTTITLVIVRKGREKP